MRFGIWVLNVFAALFAMAALAGLAAPPWSWPAPLVLSAGVVVFCIRYAEPPPSASQQEARRIGRVVALWSGVEGVAILAAIHGLQDLGEPRLIGPAIGLIVGLHFLPLARWLPLRTYYVTGAALIALSAASMLLPDGYPLPASGFGCAVVLWLTSLSLAFGDPGPQSPEPSPTG